MRKSCTPWEKKKNQQETGKKKKIKKTNTKEEKKGKVRGQNRGIEEVKNRCKFKKLRRKGKKKKRLRKPIKGGTTRSQFKSISKSVKK